MARYDVPDFVEDKWHASSGAMTVAFVSKQLAAHNTTRGRLLNAGSGVYEIAAYGFDEVLLDLFARPLQGRSAAVCGNVEALPFEAGSFECVVAVGEVLAYCDPAGAIAEFARVLKPGGLLICDYSSSKSSRYWMTQSFGRAADLVVDIYNGLPERCWIYSPAYIETLLGSSGLRATEILGTHTIAGMCRRGGATPSTALRIQSALDWLQLPAMWADLITIAAVRQRT
jgi:SAM-dependent methyltransferase